MRSQLTDNFISGDHGGYCWSWTGFIPARFTVWRISNEGDFEAGFSNSLGSFLSFLLLIGRNGYAIGITPLLLSIGNHRRAQVK